MRDGHTLCVSLKLKSKADTAAVVAALQSFVPPTAAVATLPSAPPAFLEVRSEVNRPQPRMDRDAGAFARTMLPHPNLLSPLRPNFALWLPRARVARAHSCKGRVGGTASDVANCQALAARLRFCAVHCRVLVTVLRRLLRCFRWRVHHRGWSRAGQRPSL